MLSPNPLILSVDEACFFLHVCLPNCWPWHLCQFWEKRVLCSLCLHPWGLWCKAHICTGKADCKSFLQRVATTVRWAGLCLQLRLLTQSVSTIKWHLLKPWNRKNIFKLQIFIFTFPLIYVSAREAVQVGSVGSRRMAVLIYIGAWPDFWLYHEIPTSTLFKKKIYTYIYICIYIFPKCLLKHKSSPLVLICDSFPNFSLASPCSIASGLPPSTQVLRSRDEVGREGSPCQIWHCSR